MDLYFPRRIGIPTTVIGASGGQRNVIVLRLSSFIVMSPAGRPHSAGRIAASRVSSAALLSPPAAARMAVAMGADCNFCDQIWCEIPHFRHLGARESARQPHPRRLYRGLPWLYDCGNFWSLFVPVNWALIGSHAPTRPPARAFRTPIFRALSATPSRNQTWAAPKKLAKHCRRWRNFIQVNGDAGLRVGDLLVLTATGLVRSYQLGEYPSVGGD